MKKSINVVFIIAGLLLTSCKVNRPSANFTPIYKGTWNLVDGVNTKFNSGDIITIAAPTKGVTAGEIDSSNKACLLSTTSTFDSTFQSISDLSTSALQLKIVKSDAVYRLANSKGQFLGVDSDRSLSWGGEYDKWTIEINSNTNYNAVIRSTNTDLGQLCYNSSSSINAFKMYTVSSGKNLVFPRIYKGTSPDPIYVNKVTVNGNSSMYIGEETQFSFTYEPSSANQLRAVWSSSNRSVATVSSTGVVTAKDEGKTNIIVSLVGKDGNFVKGTYEVSVRRIAVSGIQISDSSKEIRLNRSFTLGAEISPSNASNKSVIWTSSNTTVASVNSSGVVKGLSIGTSTITATSLDGGFTDSCEVTVSNTALDEWTIMMYVCGADLESDSSQGGLATSDIREILSVAGQPEDVNIILQTGGSKKWKSTYGISANYLQRWHVRDNKLVKDADLPKASMGEASTFQSFMEWGLNEYPAEKTGVIFWNHGGAMRGCCYDELYNDNAITNYETKVALTNAFNNVGRDEKLEFVGYDCCLMQVQDIAEFNSQFFNYMIASEESESGYGWDYDTFVDDIYALKPTETILKAVVDGFIADNGGASSSRNNQTLSYLDLSKMANYYQKWEAMAAVLKNKISSASSFRSFVKSVQTYADTDYAYFSIFDAKDFLNKLSSSSTYNLGGTYVSDAITAFNQLVKYSVAQRGAGNSYGLCMFFSVSSQASKNTYYTSNMTNFTNWRSIVSSYGA